MPYCVVHSPVTIRTKLSGSSSVWRVFKVRDYNIFCNVLSQKRVYAVQCSCPSHNTVD
jgi:hypothetical protein